ncbi:MAG TPA: hypothetical protein VFN22_09995 [Gemmatimonadales bacterium]|nr:hypothetical protein [Gemmatimonadales bacterium]
MPDWRVREPMADSTDTGHRFSDQEVALVLQRATEIEEHRPGPGSGRGLTLRELHEIAHEVGLSPEVINEAVMAVQAGHRSRPHALLGAPLTTKSVRALPMALDSAAMQQLIRVIDDRIETTGTVTEALGIVRWTSADRGRGMDRSTQVSLTVRGDETQVQVVERHPARLRVVLHLLPASWGAMIAGAMAASASIGPVSGVGLALGGAALGLGLGRTVWQALARRRARDTQALADSLAGAAVGRVD